jgi:hypothetical protein
VLVRATECRGPDAGVGLSIFAPTGERLLVDGGAAQPDGTFLIDLIIRHWPPGDYRITVGCTSSETHFPYPDLQLRVL